MHTPFLTNCLPLAITNAVDSIPSPLTPPSSTFRGIKWFPLLALDATIDADADRKHNHEQGSQCCNGQQDDPDRERRLHQPRNKTHGNHFLRSDV